VRSPGNPVAQKQTRRVAAFSARALFGHCEALAAHEVQLQPRDNPASIKAGMDARAKRTEITQDRVLCEIARLAFSDKARGGPRQRFSLNAEFPDQDVDSKTAAEKLAADIRSAINAGTFRRAGERPVAAAPAAVTLEQFAEVYLERASKASGKQSWGNDAGMLSRFCAVPRSAGLRTRRRLPRSARPARPRKSRGRTQLATDRETTRAFR